jgi:hypothetical protein
MENAEINFSSRFHSALKKFLNAMSQAFPNDVNIVKYNNLYNQISASEMMREQIITEWFDAMKNHIEACKNKDIQAIASARISILEQIGFLDKYALLAKKPKNIDQLWRYINTINACAVQHCAIPSNLRNFIENAAKNLTGDVIAEKVSLDQLDVMQIGSDVMSGADPEAIEKLLDNLPVLVNTLDDIEGLDSLSSLGIKIGDSKKLLKSVKQTDLMGLVGKLVKDNVITKKPAGSADAGSSSAAAANPTQKYSKGWKRGGSA